MIIEAKDLRKGFGKLEVLKGVSFSAQAAEVVSIVGASGAGKTTLLQILGTLSRPDGGTLEIDGKNVLAMDEKRLAAFRCRKIGFVFQAHHLLPEFSALENVMMPFLIAGGKSSEAKQAAAQLLERVGLADRMNHKPSQLSGGEQQRTAIARALINKPAVLLADEPTGNLDSKTSQDVLGLLKVTSQKFSQTIVMITHNEEIAQMADRIIRIEDGRIVKTR